MAKIEHKYSCNIGAAIEVFSGRWKPEIMWHLENGPIRFNTLLKEMDGISQKILTQQLKEMQRDGLITRTDYFEKPLRVEYANTKLAESLRPVFAVLKVWTNEYGQNVTQASKLYDDKKKE